MWQTGTVRNILSRKGLEILKREQHVSVQLLFIGLNVKIYNQRIWVFSRSLKESWPSTLPGFRNQRSKVTKNPEDVLLKFFYVLLNIEILCSGEHPEVFLLKFFFGPPVCIKWTQDLGRWVEGPVRSFGPEFLTCWDKATGRTTTTD